MTPECFVSASHGRYVRLRQLWKGKFEWVWNCNGCGHRLKEPR